MQAPELRHARHTWLPQYCPVLSPYAAPEPWWQLRQWATRTMLGNESTNFRQSSLRFLRWSGLVCKPITGIVVFHVSFLFISLDLSSEYGNSGPLLDLTPLSLSLHYLATPSPPQETFSCQMRVKCCQKGNQESNATQRPGSTHLTAMNPSQITPFNTQLKQSPQYALDMVMRVRILLTEISRETKLCERFCRFQSRRLWCCRFL